MWKCPNCGSDNPTENLFCVSCGAKHPPEPPTEVVTGEFRTKTAPLPSLGHGRRLSNQTLVFILCGCMLLSAIIIAVALIFSGSGSDKGSGQSAEIVAPTPMPGDEIVAPPTSSPTPDPATVIVEPTTPPPTPVPVPEAVKVFFFEDEKEEFTMQVGETEKFHAVAYPVEQFPNGPYTWSVSDESVIQLTVSEDTRECTFTCLSYKAGGVTVTVTCNGVEKTIYVYTKKP